MSGQLVNKEKREDFKSFFQEQTTSDNTWYQLIKVTHNEEEKSFGNSKSPTHKR